MSRKKKLYSDNSPEIADACRQMRILHFWTELLIFWARKLHPCGERKTVIQLQREHHREEPPGDYNTTSYCTFFFHNGPHRNTTLQPPSARGRHAKNNAALRVGRPGKPTTGGAADGVTAPNRCASARAGRSDGTRRHSKPQLPPQAPLTSPAQTFRLGAIRRKSMPRPFALAQPAEALRLASRLNAPLAGAEAFRPANPHPRVPRPFARQVAPPEREGPTGEGNAASERGRGRRSRTSA